LREGEARNEQEILYLPPATCLVLHEIKVRRLVVADGVHHRRIRAVRDGIADARLLAFELIPQDPFPFPFRNLSIAAQL